MSCDTITSVINGHSVDSSTHETVINPANGKKLWEYGSSSLEHVSQAIKAAQAAFPTWSEVSASERQKILLRAADLFSERQQILREYMKHETAAGDDFISFNIDATVKQLKDIAVRAVNIHGSFVNVEDTNRSALVLKEPYGVVLGIAPWNAPYILGTRAVSAALATGNTVILKGSELAPRCFRAIVDIFHDAGLPAGCLNLLFASPRGAPEITQALIKHPDVAKINFTGSAAVGSIIASTAGKYLKPVLLELGGKATAIVFEDADLKKAAMGCVLGAFLHSGQVCMGTERILVQDSIAAQFSTALQETMNVIFQSPDSYPVLISEAANKRVQLLVEDALDKGAKSLCASERRSEDTTGRVLPLILGGINKDMDLFYKESFGPVATFHSFETEEEALAIANDTEYGLAGAIFTENLARGLRVAKKYTTGAVHINSMSIHDEAALPHGGCKSSGFGRFNTERGLEEFLRTKVVTWEK